MSAKRRLSFCVKKRKISIPKVKKMPPKKNVNENEEENAEGEEVEVHISFRDLEQSMTIFTGDDTYPISEFLDEFEDVADLMHWTKIERLIYVKRLLGGTAKLFLRSIGRIKDYPSLKKALKEEFGPKLNSATIHKKLTSRKMKNDETLQQYFLTMKEIALHGKVDDAALIEYVIDGIRDHESNKAILYGATDLKEFRRKLDIYSEFRKKITTRSNHQTGETTNSTASSPKKPPTVKRCYNCGDLDHQAPACKNGIKCFRCNEFGHKGIECENAPKKALNIRTKKEEEKTVPCKKMKLNGIEMVALIDTGSDANLIRKTEFEKIKDKIQRYDTDTAIRLIGIANKEVLTEGVFTAQIQIDDGYADVKFHVVQDNVIPVNIIIGNPILKDFEVKFTANGILMEKIPIFTLVGENCYITEDCDIEDSEFTKQIKNMTEDYNTNENNMMKSNVELKILVTDETPIFESPRRILPLETKAVNKRINECLEKKIIKPCKSDFRNAVVLANRKIRTPRDYMANSKEMRVKDDELMKKLEEENIQIFYDDRRELRAKARESIQKIHQENTQSYNKTRKEAKSYEVAKKSAMTEIHPGFVMKIHLGQMNSQEWPCGK